jgi:hypothetical protein
MRRRFALYLASSPGWVLRPTGPACTATSSSTTNRTSSRSRACASKPSLRPRCARRSAGPAGQPLRAAGERGQLRPDPLFLRRLRAPTPSRRSTSPSMPVQRPAGLLAGASAAGGLSPPRRRDGCWRCCARRRLAAAPDPAAGGAACRAAHEQPVGPVPPGWPAATHPRRGSGGTAWRGAAAGPGACCWPLSFFSKESGALFPFFILAWELDRPGGSRARRAGPLRSRARRAWRD